MNADDLTVFPSVSQNSFLFPPEGDFAAVHQYVVGNQKNGIILFLY